MKTPAKYKVEYSVQQLCVGNKWENVRWHSFDTKAEATDDMDNHVKPYYPEDRFRVRRIKVRTDKCPWHCLHCGNGPFDVKHHQRIERLITRVVNLAI